MVMVGDKQAFPRVAIQIAHHKIAGMDALHRAAAFLGTNRRFRPVRGAPNFFLRAESFGRSPPYRTISKRASSAGVVSIG